MHVSINCDYDMLISISNFLFTILQLELECLLQNMKNSLIRLFTSLVFEIQTLHVAWINMSSTEIFLWNKYFLLKNIILIVMNMKY